MPKNKDYDRRTFRLFYILNKLNNSKPVSTREFAEKFNVSLRTVQRDLEILNSAGFYLALPKEESISLKKVCTAPFILNPARNKIERTKDLIIGPLWAFATSYYEMSIGALQKHLLLGSINKHIRRNKDNLPLDRLDCLHKRAAPWNSAFVS